MRLSRHVCGYIGREVGVLRYELYGLVTLIYRVQVDSHVREVGTGGVWRRSTYRPNEAPRYDREPDVLGTPGDPGASYTPVSRVYPDYRLYRTLRAQSTLYRHGVYSRLVGPIT